MTEDIDQLLANLRLKPLREVVEREIARVQTEVDPGFRTTG